jgi:hypothetical protein
MLGRHYGLPTRILDWSWNPLVALYFAAQEDKTTPGVDGCIWALERGRMNLQMMGDRRFLAADEPQVLNIAELAFESKMDEFHAKTGAPPRRRGFRVPSASKFQLLEVLGAIGIRKSSLFPDLGALAEDIKLRSMLAGP